VGEKIANLESAEAGLVLASGMAAVSTTLFGLLRAGDHALFHTDLYGGTLHFVTETLPRFGIEFSTCDLSKADLADHIRPNTRLIYAETPSNPLLRITDLRRIASFAKPHGIWTVVDNTFASPVNQRPVELGFDLVIHSGTKYLNGHSDVLCGAVLGSGPLVDLIRKAAIGHGGVLDPRACWLLERGLKTLALRVQRQNANAQCVAEFLRGHSRVSAVHYPGLVEHPGHSIARDQMDGYGGMLSFEIGGTVAEADVFLAKLALVTPAVSLGGVESLIGFPARTSHSLVTPEERERMGIRDNLLRLSIGVEDAEDIIEDLDQALS
jgi:cystathionine beta-lyase